MTEDIDRREFLSAASAMALLGGASIVIASCGSDNSVTPPPPPPPPPPQGNQAGVVSTNHGHVANVTGASVNAATGELSLDIRGSANHPHTVVLTSAQLTAIRAGEKVSLLSTNNDGFLPDGTPVPHTHTVAFN